MSARRYHMMIAAFRSDPSEFYDLSDLSLDEVSYFISEFEKELRKIKKTSRNVALEMFRLLARAKVCD
jgi:hypothetical protein